LDLNHLQERSWQSGHLEKNTKLTPSLFKDLLSNKIKRLDVQKAVFDVKRFVSNRTTLDIWSNQYFLDLAEKIQIV
jgi:hypothetical protein